MAQDPAFLFYTNDFISGTQFFTDEEVGLYIRLLCAQHQHGRLSEKQVKIICKTLDTDVLQKFTKDTDGLYYNIRLETEIEKRKSYSESRSNNRKGKVNQDVKTKKDKKNTSKTYVKHMENENEDINKDKIIINKTIAEFKDMRVKLKKPMTDRAVELLLLELEKLAPNNEPLKIQILNQSIQNSWLGVFPLKQQQPDKQVNSFPIPR